LLLLGGLCGHHWEEVQATTSLQLSTGPDGTGVVKTATMKAPRKRCAVEGCEKVAKGRCEGRCQLHFKEYLRSLEAQDAATGGTDGAASQAKRTKFFCKLEGCERQSAGACEGYCTRHYREQNPGGVAAERLTAMGKKCKYVQEDGSQCDKLAQGGCGGLCKRHWSISGSVGSGKKVARCSVAGCGKYARRKGMCQKHFREVHPEEYKASVTAEDPGIAGKRCAVDGCTKWARGKVGMCRRHARESGLLVDEGPSKATEVAEAVAAGVDPRNLLPALPEQDMKVAPDGAAKDEGVVDAASAVDVVSEVVNEIAGAEATEAAESDPTKCVVAACEAPPGIGGYRGMCIAHWLESERERASSAGAPRRKRCSVEDCEKQARDFGMCHRHGRQYHGDYQRAADAGVAPGSEQTLMSPSKRRKMDTLVGVAAAGATEVAGEVPAVAAAEAVAQMEVPEPETEVQLPKQEPQPGAVPEQTIAI